MASRIARKDYSCAEVVEAHLHRIDTVNPGLNAIVKTLAEDARRNAAEADLKIARGQGLGPLHGVPFTIKENIDLADYATTCGVPALANAIAPADAPVVERMRAAGAIAIARTNLPDVALRAHTKSSLYGLARNPWNRNRTAGGSSGGEAVAIATGMSPLGLGTDIGGSLRNPANACGIASIRRKDVAVDPTGRGRQSVRPALGLRSGRPRRGDWPADWCASHREAHARRRMPRRGRGNRAPARIDDANRPSLMARKRRHLRI